MSDIKQLVTHSFDEYNNLTMIIHYGEVTFEYQYSESYLNKMEDWKRDIKGYKAAKGLNLGSGDTQSWQPILSMSFPESIKLLFIAELEKAITDPRINTIVSDSDDDNKVSSDDGDSDV